MAGPGAKSGSVNRVFIYKGHSSGIHSLQLISADGMYAPLTTINYSWRIKARTPVLSLSSVCSNACDSAILNRHGMTKQAALKANLFTTCKLMIALSLSLLALFNLEEQWVSGEGHHWSDLLICHCPASQLTR